MGELASLVRENGGSGVIDLIKDVVNLASIKLLHVVGFKRDGFGFGGTNVRASLVQMAFWCFHSFGVVLLDIASGEKRPTDEIPGLNGFEPS